MKRTDDRVESHSPVKPQTIIPGIVLWAGILLLAGGLLVGLAEQEVLWAENTLPAGEHRDGPMTDIHDIKPALALGADLYWLIWLAVAVVGVAILAAAAWWLWRRRRKTTEESKAAPLPAPEVEAYTLLDGLAAGDHGDLKHFYFRLSAILRRYIERRYEIPAAEMTTEELLPALGRLDLSLDMAQEVRSFCFRSDPIKFASASADAGRVAHELAFVRDFVRQTTASVATEIDPQSAMRAVEAPETLVDAGKFKDHHLKQIPGSDGA